MMKILRSKGGKGERTVDINQVEIPDLWHHAWNIRVNGRVRKQYRNMVADEILECWHVAHDLKKHICEQT